MSSPQTSEAFRRVAAPYPQKGRSFSIWLNPAERAFLEAKAGAAPLGSYIKDRALTDQPKKKRRRGNIADDKALAKALALLGQSRIGSNLNQIAKAANIGTLPVTPDIVEEIETACETIGIVRSLLIEALGLKA